MAKRGINRRLVKQTLHRYTRAINGSCIDGDIQLDVDAQVILDKFKKLVGNTHHSDIPVLALQHLPISYDMLLVTFGDQSRGCDDTKVHIIIADGRVEITWLHASIIIGG